MREGGEGGKGGGGWVTNLLKRDEVDEEEEGVVEEDGIGMF